MVITRSVGRVSLVVAATIACALLPVSATAADWADAFDSYATGSQLHGQGGWKGWSNSPAAGALTSAAFNRSAPNSAEIVGASDLVHEYNGVTDGTWVLTAWQYIPAGFSGNTYVILLNRYDDAGANLNWSTQVRFNSVSGMVVNEGASGGQLPLVTAQWVELRVEIDLVGDLQRFYYNGSLLFQGSWSGEVSGGGATALAALNLFANSASAVYYDDLSVVETSAELALTPTSVTGSQVADAQVSHPLAVGNLGSFALGWALGDGAEALWQDSIDDYATGSQLHGLGGWKGWANTPAAGALVSAAFSRSAPRSIEIVGASDLVHEFAGVADGTWVLTAWQYIPAGFSGDSYLILLNQYDDAGVSLNWSTQVRFNSVSGMVANEGVSGGQLPLVTAQWVELRVEIDLVGDQQRFYYNGTLLFQGSWSNEVSGGGATALAALNLFANSASAVYYDDLSVTTACDSPAGLPWLSVSPTAGTVPPAGSTPVDVITDSSGLTVGTYDATLCVPGNDPDERVVRVPVHMDVVIPVELMSFSVE